MLALYRCGREADALAVMADARARLKEELGRRSGGRAAAAREGDLVSGFGARRVALRAALALPAAPPPSAAAAPTRATSPAEVSAATRKTVTVIFCDVVASSTLAGRLDPEALRRVMSGFFDLARRGDRATRRYGGEVHRGRGGGGVRRTGGTGGRRSPCSPRRRRAARADPDDGKQFAGDTGARGADRRQHGRGRRRRSGAGHGVRHRRAARDRQAPPAGRSAR